MSRVICSACAAAYEGGAPGGASCPYCGTDSHVRVREGMGADEIPAPSEIPPPPPRDRDIEQWNFEQWVGALLREEQARRRIEIAEAMPAFGEHALVWAPAIADLMIDADERLDVALGNALGELAGTWNSTALRGQVLRVVRARLPRLPGSRGVVSALAGVGVAGLKTLLELANQADERGDAARVSEILNPTWEVVDRQTDDVAAACLEVLFRLLPEAGPATRRFVIHYLADCVDSRYEAALDGPRDGRDFRFLIPMMVCFMDDHVEEHPELIAELSEEIQRLHAFHSKSLRDSRDWSHAAKSARSQAGRTVVNALIRALYPPESPFALDEPWSEMRERHAVSGEMLAEVIDGRARCPACGAPLPTRGSEAVVSCERCTRPVRMPSGVRTELAGHSFADEIEHWSEAELVRTLRTEPALERRRQIAAEIDSARTHGARYVNLVGELAEHMIEEDDDDVVIDLQNALERMARTGGAPFCSALIEAVRLRPAARSQSRLLSSLGLCGEEAFEVLIASGQACFAESRNNHSAAADGSSAFSAALQILESSDYSQALIDRLLTLIREMPEGHDNAGQWQSGEEAASVVAQVFTSEENDPVRESLKREGRDAVLQYLDTRIDSKETEYSGMAPHPGSALFFKLGGVPGFERLVGFIESLWESPLDPQDLDFRLDCLQRAQTDEIKLIVLCSIKERPAGLDDGAVARAEQVLRPLLEPEHLAASARAVIGVLHGVPVAQQQQQASGRFPSTRIGLWWYAFKLRLRWWFGRG